ncbi:MAG TPA: molybdopterin-dependent oxidoreductase, partial [Candidatus Limnocylindria bacterium]|nr:molybdopterin-dependent oxidoreductase [Candidatus Limnocylindria bacterium]
PGKWWRRATWDEALNLIAEKLLDNIYNHGPDTNAFFSVIPAMSPAIFCAGSRLANYLGSVMCSSYNWYCDLHPGEPSRPEVGECRITGEAPSPSKPETSLMRRGNRGSAPVISAVPVRQSQRQ